MCRPTLIFAQEPTVPALKLRGVEMRATVTDRDLLHPNSVSSEEDEDVRSAVLQLLLETSTYTGECFLERLTDAIASYFSVDSVYLCELALEVDRYHLLASHGDEAASADPASFQVAGPFEVVIDRGSLVQEMSVLERFPADLQLKALRAEAFIGTVLRAESTDPIGALFLIHHEPLPEAQYIASVLNKLAPRIGAELERLQHESEVKKSEARLRALTDQSKDALFYLQLTPAVEIQYISPAVSAIFGLPQEAFHANPELVFEMLDAQERPRFREAIESGSEEPFVARIHRPDGETRWVEYRDFALWDGKRLAGIGGTIRDITRRVEAEDAMRENERYVRSLLASIPDTLILVRLDGVVMDYVPGEVNAGFGDPEQVKGRNLKELMSPAIVGVLERSMRAGARSQRVQRVQFEVPSEHPRTYDVSCLPFGQGALLLVLRDLTAQKWHEGEERRQQLRDEIDQRIERPARSNAYGLTYRELAVLSLVVEGMADKQIADELGISIYTVNKHVGNVLGKMNAASRTEAGVRAVKEGLLPRDQVA
jgi:PAS domain S-box-containing protein